MLDTYGKLYHLGHRSIQPLFTEPVYVEEKIDGSQFSFAVVDGTLYCRSRGSLLDVEATTGGLFGPAVQAVRALKDELTPGFIYRGEAMCRPKHNVLAYERAPEAGFILFDVESMEGGKPKLLTPEEKKAEAERLGLEVVPCFFTGKLTDLEQIKKLLDTPSMLGGVMEGVVFKSATLKVDGHFMRAKYVSEQFQEVQNSGRVRKSKMFIDFRHELAQQYRTEARWLKALQRLAEADGLDNSPKDIGNLMRLVNQDIEEECSEEIKEKLYDWARKPVLRGATQGLAEWYKEKLAGNQFGGSDE